MLKVILSLFLIMNSLTISKEEGIHNSSKQNIEELKKAHWCFQGQKLTESEEVYCHKVEELEKQDPEAFKYTVTGKYGDYPVGITFISDEQKNLLVTRKKIKKFQMLSGKRYAYKPSKDGFLILADTLQPLLRGQFRETHIYHKDLFLTLFLTKLTKKIEDEKLSVKDALNTLSTKELPLKFTFPRGNVSEVCEGKLVLNMIMDKWNKKDWETFQAEIAYKSTHPYLDFSPPSTKQTYSSDAYPKKVTVEDKLQNMQDRVGMFLHPNDNFLEKYFNFPEKYFEELLNFIKTNLKN